MNVQSMFGRIAPRYDLLNHLLSLGADRGWRRRAVACASQLPHGAVLDLACGTGDLTVALAEGLTPQRLVAADFSAQMLELAQRKMARLLPGREVELRRCAAEDLPFGEGEFDLVTIAFGVRNFANLERAMRECSRVLRPGGHLVVLEFTLPGSRVVRGLYGAYSATVMPLVGGLLSGSFSAYRYLPRSIRSFARSGALPRAIGASGMPIVRAECYTLGVVELVVARKPQ